MKKIKAGLWAGCLLLLLLFLIGTPVLAEEPRLVVDQADLLSDAQEQQLEERAVSLQQKWNMDFVILTTADADGKDAETYADDYYDENGYGENGILYLIDMDNRQVWISTAGAGIRYLTDSRIDRVIDAGYDQLVNQEYGACFLSMLQRTENYLNIGIPDQQYTYDRETGKVTRHYGITKLEGLAAVGAAAAAGLILFLSVHGSYRMKRKAYTYPFRELGSLHLTNRQDRFVNQTITRRRIPRNDDSRGGGGGGGRSTVHTSGGGISHGGGGRSF